MGAHCDEIEDDIPAIEANVLEAHRFFALAIRIAKAFELAEEVRLHC
jgi:hypothetical protein